MALSQLATLILKNIPPNATISGGQLRLSTNLSDSQFKQGVNELRDAKLIEVSPGQGGVYKHASKSTTRSSKSNIQTDNTGLRPAAAPITTKAASSSLNLTDEGREIDYYPKIKRALEAHWVRTHEFDRSLVEITACMGGRPTGGKWSRPDLLVITEKRFKFLPDVCFDVWSFEVKAPGRWSIDAVSETFSHGRFFHFPILILLSDTTNLDSGSKETLAQCKEEAERMQVGLYLMHTDFDPKKWMLLAEPYRHGYSPEVVDRQLDILLSDSAKQTLRSWRR